MFGYSPDELIGETIEKLIPERFREFHKGYCQKYRESPKSRPMGIGLELFAQRKDGSTFPVEISLSFKKTDDELYVMAFIIDITKRKEVQLALVKKSAEFSSIFNSSPQALLFTNIDKRILRVNPQFSKLTGYKIEEIKGKEIDFLLSDKNIYDELRDFYFRFDIQEPLELIDLDLKSKNSVNFLGQTIITSVKDDNDKYLGFLVSINDITKTRKLESEFKQIFNLSTDLICIMGLDGYFKNLNPAWERVLGYKINELKSKKFTSFIHPDDVKDSFEVVSKIMKGESVQRVGFENRYICKDGSVRWFSWQGASVSEEGLLYAIARDITEEKKNLKSLKESQERLEDFLLNVTDLIQIVGADGKILFANKAWQKILNYTEDEYKNLHYKEIIHEDCVDYCSDIFERVSLGETFENVEACFKSKEGKKVIVEGNISGRFIDGKFIATRGVFRDVTLSKKAGEEIRKLSKAVSQSANSIIITDIDGNIEYVNPKFTQLTGYTLEEVINQNPRFLKSGYQSQELYEELWETISSGQEWRGEFLNKKKNGELYWELASFSPIKDNKGEITHYVAVKEDISLRKELEENLQKENAKLSTVIANIEDGIVLADPKGNIIEVNQYYCELFDEKKEDILGMKIYDLAMVEGKEDIKSIIKNYYDNLGAKIYSSQISIEDKEVILRAQPIYREKIYYGVLLSFVNVTELVKAKHQVESAFAMAKEALVEAENAKKQAEEANKFKSEFLANMSHEIRTPLNSIIGFSEQLGEEKLSKDQKEYVGYITNSGNHLLALVNDILDLSKIEAGKIEIIKSVFDVWELVDEVINIVKPRANSKGLKIKFYIRENVPELLEGDRKHIKQILLNLLSNGVKFTERGLVNLKVFKGNELDEGKKGYFLLAISVEDTGVGIPINKQELIFEPFDRGSDDTVRKFEGTGLGLSITQKLLYLMGGNIAVISTPGKGSIFTINIPLRIGKQSEIVKEEELFKKSPKISMVDEGKVVLKRTYDMLLVEDNPVNQKLVQVYLKGENCNLVISGDGLDAVEKATYKQFDIIFMDIQIPKLDGYETTKRIRENKFYKDIPIIALTAHAMKADYLKAKEAGCTDYLSKPIRKQVLIDTINKYLGIFDFKEKFEGRRYKKRDIDPEVLDLIPWFIGTIEDNLKVIKESLKQNEFETIRIKGHQLRGSGASFGFEEITDIGSKLESAARGNDKSKVEKIAEELQEVIKQIKKEVS